MTLGEMIRDIELELDLGRGSDEGASYLFIRQRLVDGANYIADKTDCLFGTRTINMVAEQSLYCLPGDLKRQNAVNILDAAGQWWPLTTFDSPGHADQMYGSDWRNRDSVDPPTIGIFYGRNKIELYPPPSEDRDESVRFNGVWKPGPFWAWDDTTFEGIPLADTQECPLPQVAHPCLVAWGKWKAASKDKRAEQRTRAGEFQGEFNSLLGDIEADTATYKQRMPFRVGRGIGRGHIRLRGRLY